MHNNWVDVLNPDLVRAKFVTLGLYMVAYEMLLSAIKEPLHDFFADKLTAEKGWETSEEYRREVLALDPRGKGDALRGSLAWLRKMDVVTEADEAQVREFTDARNAIAHEMREIVGGDAMPDMERLLPLIVELVTKIDRWWLVNVEIATNPDLAGRDFDEDAVTPGSTMMLQILSRVALGDDDEAWALYRQFVNR